VNQTSAAEIPPSKVEILARIQESFATLDAVVAQCNEGELNQAAHSAWTIKDHLTHLALWQQATAELLQSRNRFSLMGVEDIFAHDWSEIDKVNELIHRSYSHLSAAEAKELIYGAHQRLLEAMDSWSDEDLQCLYVVYRSDGDQKAREIPIWKIIVWTTYGHYQEHISLVANLIPPVYTYDQD
jgi:hypothetical protein